MRNGVCRACGSQTVYSKTYGVKIGEVQGVYVQTSMMTMAVPYVSFVCSSCGYFENYIAEPKKLAEVAAKWTKVTG